MAAAKRYAEFETAQIPTPYFVLGVVLTKFTLGHLTLLSRRNLPCFPEAVAFADNQELLRAVIACGLSFEEGVEVLSSPSRLGRVVQEWTRKVSRRLRLIPRRLDFKAARETFAKYLEDGLLLPRVLRYDNSQPVDFGAPHLLWLKTQLMQFMSESEALNKHLPLAHLEIFANGESKIGRKLLFGDEEREREQELNDRADELAAIERSFNGARN